MPPAAAATAQRSEAPLQTAKSINKPVEEHQQRGVASPRTDVLTAPAASAAAAAGSTSATTGSAAAPRAAETAPIPLRHLNNTNGKLAAWDVAIAHAHVEDYSYSYDEQSRTSKVFKLLLTG